MTKVEKLLMEINENLRKLINEEIKEKPNAIRVPKEPKFSGSWKRKSDYIMDEKGMALLTVAKQHLDTHGALPPMSFLCRQAGIKYHEFTNRFQNKSNFTYYLMNEAM